MNAKFSVFVIKAETIIYLLSHNLHDCTYVHVYMTVLQRVHG